MKKLLIIDNYDSFTYNLVHGLESDNNFEVEVIRNDKILLDQVSHFDKIVISPGPGLPEEAGSLMEIIQKHKFDKPILGVCLGHQAIIESFGGQLSNLPKVYHGVESIINVVDLKCPLFQGVPEKFVAGRYHSWAANKSSFPREFKITSLDENNTIMSCRHESLPIYGVQFHPESVMTPCGKEILTNFLKL